MECSFCKLQQPVSQYPMDSCDSSKQPKCVQCILDEAPHTCKACNVEKPKEDYSPFYWNLPARQSHTVSTRTAEKVRDMIATYCKNVCKPCIKIQQEEREQEAAEAAAREERAKKSRGGSKKEPRKRRRPRDWKRSGESSMFISIILNLSNVMMFTSR